MPIHPLARLDPARFVPFAATTFLKIPFFDHRVPAGFPSPAEDHFDRRLDLNDLCIRHPSATYFVEVEGHSMTGAGIQPGDVLVVDKAVTPRGNCIVVALIDGEFTLKRIRQTPGGLLLLPENPDFAPIAVTPDTAFEVWGVVTYVIHAVK